MNADNLIMRSEKINNYDIFYTLEKKLYPYYILTKIEVYKGNILKLSILADVREYDGYTMGAEYKKIDILSKTTKRTIEINMVNSIVEDTIIGSEEEISFYEKEIFKSDIFTYLHSKRMDFNTPLKETKKRRLLPRFNK